MSDPTKGEIEALIAEARECLKLPRFYLLPDERSLISRLANALALTRVGGDEEAVARMGRRLG